MSVVHPFDPIYDQNSQILILGSFPSVKSRDVNFYYGHAQNRFWKVIGDLFEEDEPKEITKKKNILLKHHIALWDVVKSCDIKGSSDVTIRNVKVNDIEEIIHKTKIHKICFNGHTAYRIFHRYYKEGITGIETCVLPSTSPANATYNYASLLETWRSEMLDEKLCVS